MKLKEFFKPNKFKLIFFIAFIVITLLVFIIGEKLKSGILESVFVILIYFPAILTSGWSEIYSIPIFLLYFYILSCLLDIFVGKLKK